MTLADRIRSMSQATTSTRTIADTLGCKTSYVRVVLRQRVGGVSEADMRYLSSPKGALSKKASRASCLARKRALKATNGDRKQATIEADKARNAVRQITLVKEQTDVECRAPVHA